MEKIFLKLEEKRKEKGLYKHELAAVLGVTRGYLSEMVSGKKPLTMKVEAAIKKFLDS